MKDSRILIHFIYFLKSFVMKIKKLIISYIFFNFVFLSFGISADENLSFDFSDCDLKDILYAVSLDCGYSIIPDDTIEGKGSFKFAGGNFESAFDAFLLANRLYVIKNDNTWIVSKFKFTNHNDIYAVDAFDLYPHEIIEKITENVSWAITFDNLPARPVSVHLKGMKKEELVLCLCKIFGSYEAEKNGDGYHLIHKELYSNNNEYNYNNSDYINDNNTFLNIICNDDNSFYVDIKNENFFNVIESLFLAAGEKTQDETLFNYCFLGNSDVNVKRAFFTGKDFNDTLNKLCAQNGFEYILDENIYYIVLNNNSKSKIISGQKNWNSFSLAYTNTKEFLPVLFKKFGNVESIELFDGTSFLCNCSDIEKNEIEAFIKDVDIKRSVYLVSLKYLKPEEFLAHLPPNIDKNSVYAADDNSCLYFRGTEEAYNNLCQQINICDKPVTKLSYDLLILQYDETKQNTWSSSFGAKKLKMGDRSSLAATLGSVMGFNLNVVAAFGVAFAAELQASIEENSTRVYADTTLHGVAGKKISFQNTNTYRYRDNNVDPESGKPVYSGVTREIITGIKIDVLGWVSGDGVITSSVTASISRQGMDLSSSTGNPPPTSEKLVTTEVSGKSGEPIILSGLLLSAENNSQKRAPFISKIPIIGNLFKNKSDNKENSQMIIYLVPHIKNDTGSNLQNGSDTNNSQQDSSYGIDWFENKMDILINSVNLNNNNFCKKEE